MNIIQSYFNKNISISDINYTGGYLSPIVNWLSMAYSCLLLRRHNPYDRLIFYGDTDIIYLFINSTLLYFAIFFCAVIGIIISYKNNQKENFNTLLAFITLFIFILFIVRLLLNIRLLYLIIIIDIVLYITIFLILKKKKK